MKMIWVSISAIFITVSGIEAVFGNDCGGLLFNEAECEDKFSQVNMIDGVKMEPLDSPDLPPE